MTNPKAPNVFSLRALLDCVDGVQMESVAISWIPARPLGNGSILNRIRAAWLVFTGRADAVIWPEGQ